MKIIRNLKYISKPIPPIALTIGNFDGVHLGHLQIFDQVKKIAKDQKIASAVLTFEPHPTSLLRADKPKDFRITSLAQKLKIFAEQKIDYVFILPFNQDLANISAKSFIKDILIEGMNSKYLVVGYDFIFGKNREGNFQLLQDQAKNFDLELSEIPALKKSDQIYSSSLVRSLIAEGRIIEVNQFLGKNFTVVGVVNEGRKLASKIGFSTANIISKPHIIKPKFGVYKSKAFIPYMQKKFSSITNFGVKPTIDGISAPIYETHIFDFNQNIYGKKIEVELLDFIREEEKFSSVEALCEQIKRDIATLKTRKKINL